MEIEEGEIVITTPTRDPDEVRYAADLVDMALAGALPGGEPNAHVKFALEISSNVLSWTLLRGGSTSWTALLAGLRQIIASNGLAVPSPVDHAEECARYRRRYERLSPDLAKQVVRNEATLDGAEMAVRRYASVCLSGLPPVVFGECECCDRVHPPDSIVPCDPASRRFRLSFARLRGYYPGWDEAMAGCDEDVQADAVSFCRGGAG